MAYYIWAEEHSNFSPGSFSSFEPHGVDIDYDPYNVSVFHGPISIDHDDYGHNYDYDNCPDWYSCGDPSINYFAHSYMEPKLIAYELVEYVSHHTQCSISYSKVDSCFNEPEFEEYDPTPYGGGYDIISVYGKPIPPSDQTCYPRSKPKTIGPRPTPMPNSGSQPEIKSGPEPKSELDLVPMPDPLELKEVGERERGEYSYHNYGYDYPWPEYDHTNATGLGYDYGYGKQVVQIPPCEYSPEVVDLCESIFGNWPCLARIRKQQMGMENDSGKTGPEIGHLNPWEECASYIFGRPIASYNV